MVKKCKKIYHPEQGIKGKLCSEPTINNADLYFAFYQGGYKYAEIARFFGKNYYVVRESVQRIKDPENNRLYREDVRRVKRGK